MANSDEKLSVLLVSEFFQGKLYFWSQMVINLALYAASVYAWSRNADSRIVAATFFGGAVMTIGLVWCPAVQCRLHMLLR